MADCVKNLPGIEVVVSGSGNDNPLALSGPGLVTPFSITNTEWRQVLASQLTDRRVLNIQNKTGQLVKVNYNRSPSDPFVGMDIEDGEERNYDVLSSFTIWARSESSEVTLFVEEIKHT